MALQVRCVGISFGDPCPSWLGPRRAHFLWVVRRDWLWVGLEGLRAKVAGGFGRQLYSAHGWTRRFPGPRNEYSLCLPSHLRRDGAPCSRRDCRLGQTVLSVIRPRRVARAGCGPRITGARGQRRCRQPTRPVLKHGPRSLTRARVRGSLETPWRNESEGRRAPAEVGSRPRGAGRTTGPSRPLRRGGGA